jgi:hypothetical protein
MPIHHVKDGKLEKYEKLSVDKEQKIEEFIEKHPKLLGEDIFIIGRQISTPIGRLDLLGLDKNGNVIIVELKKGLPSRQVVSQILDYAVWGEELQYDDLNKIAKENHLDGSLDLYKKFEKTFGEVPTAFNQFQRLYVISESFDSKTTSICRYLKRSGINISCISINFHKHNEHEVVNTELVVGSEETLIEEFGDVQTAQKETWNERLQSTSDTNKNTINQLISKIEQKFNTKAMPNKRWLYFCTKLPYERKNLFTVLALRKDGCDIRFRIDSSTFEFGSEVRDVKGYFFPKGTERRIRYSAENEDLIFRCIEHALKITQS